MLLSAHLHFLVELTLYSC